MSSKGLPASEVRRLRRCLKAQGLLHRSYWQMAPGSRERHGCRTSRAFDDSLLMASGLYLPEDHPECGQCQASLSIPSIKFLMGAPELYAASFQLRRSGPVRARRLPHRLLDRRIHQGDSGQQEPTLLPLSGPLGHPHAAAGHSREDYEAVGDIRPHRKRVYAAHGSRPRPQREDAFWTPWRQKGLADNTMVVIHQR